MPSAYKLVPIRPLSGIFDARSLPDEIGAGSFRLVKNMAVRAPGKRCRRGGWRQLFSERNQNNFDLHDQLLGLQAYYDAYSAFLSGGGEFDHYLYESYYPPVYIGGRARITTDNLGWLGSPYGVFPEGFTPDDCFFYFYYAFPPQFYYFIACHETLSASVTHAGYPYGDYIAVYDPTFGYTYDYCGTVPLLRGGCNEAITYLAEFRSPRNFRKLIAGTKSRLYALNERTGNWRILADGLGGFVDPTLDCAGCSGRRFLSAQQDSILLLTNDFDPPLYWYFDDDPAGCDLWSAQPIEDLEDLDVTKVGCVAVHKGFAFYCAVEQDGVYYPHRVIWSDFNNAISVLPTSDSLAGFQDIGSGERILRAEPLGDYLYIYTDQAIHRGSLVSTDEIWNFEQIYRGPDAMKYKFSLINTGDDHYYLAADKIMRVTLADANPIEVDWMRATSSVIFDGIDEFETIYGPLNNDQCNLVTGGYNAGLKELWWSWPTGDNLCPNVSLVFNLTRNQEAADLVDHGFTAFCFYESDQLPTIADWLHELGVCDFDEITSALVKEGDPLETESEAPESLPTCIWNETENPDLPSSEDSLCAMLINKYPEDYCRGCTGQKKFIMASATDFTLKQYEDALYYRERLANNIYVQDGYNSVIASGAENLRIDSDKQMRRLKVEYKAEEQTTPNLLYGYVGFGQEASCLTWKNIRNVTPSGDVEPGVELRCLSEFTAAEHAANQTRAGYDAIFHTAVRGKFLAYRLRVTGTGGGVCFSSVQMDVSKSESES